MTKVNWSKQLVLALALIAMGSFAYWQELRNKPQKEAAEEQSKKILQLKDIPVKEFRMVTDQKDLDFKCLDTDAKSCRPGDNAKWEMTTPLKSKADDSNVNSLISAMNNLNSTETIDLKTETPEKRAQLLKEYGLDSAARDSKSTRKLYVTTPSGVTVAYFGLQHPINDSFFVLTEHVAPNQQPGKLVDEDHVRLVPSYFKSNFDRDLTYWRDKKLISILPGDIENFELENSKGKFQATRKDNQWTLHSGRDEFLGDIENIDSFLSSTTYLAAKDFASDLKADAKAKEALKGTKPILTLKLERVKALSKGQEAQVVLTIYSKNDESKKPKDAAAAAKKPKVYATVSNADPLFELEPAAHERFEKSLKDLRLAKLITSVERYAAKKLSFEGKPLGPQPLILENAEGKWLSQPEKAEASHEKVQNFLDRISGNRVKDYILGKNIPSGEDEGIKFTLSDDKVPVKRQILFWKNGDKFYARDLRSKKGEALLVDTEIKDGLPWARDFFKKVDAPPAAAAGKKK